MQRGLRAWQTRRPCQISWCEKRIHFSFGMTFIKSCSIFLGSRVLGQIEAPDSRCTWVSTTTPAGDAERRAEHHVRRLPRHAGQREQLLHRLRNLAVKLLDDFLARAHDRFRLVAEKSGGADVLLEFARIRVGKGFRALDTFGRASR